MRNQATTSLKRPSERKRHIGRKMSVRLPAFYLFLFTICSLRQLVTGGLLPNSYPKASKSDRSVDGYMWSAVDIAIVLFFLLPSNSVVIEKQYLIELPVQYEYVPLNNGQINLRSRTDENSRNSYQEYSSSNQQQQEALSGYQYQAPQMQLPPLIRPSIVTTTQRPSFVAAGVPFQEEIHANVIQSLVGWLLRISYLEMETLGCPDSGHVPFICNAYTGVVLSR